MTIAPRPFSCRSRGFTLIEALAAITIMAIVLPTLLYGITLAGNAAALVKQRNLAASLGEAKLNELVATNEWQTGSLSGDFGDDGPGITWVANVTPYSDPNMTTENLQQIDLVVSWMSHHATRSVTLTTLVYVPASSSGLGGGELP